jgi:hypothetical protein
MTMTLIETKTLTGTQASIEFTSIPQDGTDLLILTSLRDNGGSDIGQYISFNGSTSNFAARYLFGNPALGSPVQSGSLARYTGSVASGNTANTFNNTSIYIPNYSGSRNKSYSVDNVTENNAASANLNIVGGLWSDTAAITSLALSTITTSWVSGCVVSLYKITKGSDGIVTVS